MFRRKRKKGEEPGEAAGAAGTLLEEEERKKEVEAWWRQEAPPEEEVIEEGEEERGVSMEEDLLSRLKDEIESVCEESPLLGELEDVDIHELLTLAREVKGLLEAKIGADAPRKAGESR